MTQSEYKSFLVSEILSMQKDEGWTKERLMEISIRRLEMIFDTVGIPDYQIDWRLVGK